MSKHVLRSIPGHVAFLVAVVVGAAGAVLALQSFFYEGWGQPLGTALMYLLPAAVVVVVLAVAVARPRLGGVLLLLGGLGTGAWWVARRAVAGVLSSQVVLTAVVFFAPVVVLGALFLLEHRHRQYLATEGQLPSSGRWARRFRAVLIIGVPLVAAALVAARQVPDLLARHDDGLRGERTVAGNGVTLVWAPLGPGWNQRQADGSYPSWEALTTYGGSGAGVCGHLSDDGSRLVAEAVRLWRLPTTDEVLRSLTRGGRNAGCTWDGRADHAVCAQPPDKETPLWAPDQAPIYLLTSDPAGDGFVLGVNYTGGVTAHLRTASGIGYRCVRAPR